MKLYKLKVKVGNAKGYWCNEIYKSTNKQRLLEWLYQDVKQGWEECLEGTGEDIPKITLKIQEIADSQLKPRHYILRTAI